MPRNFKKKCLSCGEPELLAQVTITKLVPFADRGGTVKIGGQKLGQIDLKRSWDADESGNEQKIRGPIFCASCETEHYWVAGAKDPLRIGSVEEAREVGYEGLLED